MGSRSEALVWHHCDRLRTDGSASWHILHPHQEPAPRSARAVREEQQGFASLCGHPRVAQPFSGPPNTQGVPIPWLTPPCVSYCAPGQHLRPRAGSQYGTGSRVLYGNAWVKCSQVIRQTLFLFHVRCQHKQNILFPDQNMELFPRSALNSCCSQTKLQGCCTSPVLVFMALGIARTDKWQRVWGCGMAQDTGTALLSLSWLSQWPAASRDGI